MRRSRNQEKSELPRKGEKWGAGKWTPEGRGEQKGVPQSLKPAFIRAINLPKGTVPLEKRCTSHTVGCRHQRHLCMGHLKPPSGARGLTGGPMCSILGQRLPAPLWPQRGGSLLHHYTDQHCAAGPQQNRATETERDLFGCPVTLNLQQKDCSVQPSEESSALSRNIFSMTWLTL